METNKFHSAANNQINKNPGAFLTFALNPKIFIFANLKTLPLFYHKFGHGSLAVFFWDLMNNHRLQLVEKVNRMVRNRKSRIVKNNATNVDEDVYEENRVTEENGSEKNDEISHQDKKQN